MKSTKKRLDADIPKVTYKVTYHYFARVWEWLQMQEDKIWLTEVGVHMKEDPRFGFPGSDLTRRLF